MTTADYAIVAAEWPEKVPASKKALLDFIESGLPVAEITGNKDFLTNVRRAAKSNEEINAQVELRMQSNRLYVRRKEDGTA